MGSPFGGSAGSGILDKDHLRITGLYKYGYFETYYHGTTRLVNYGPVRNSHYNYLSIVISYGLSKRLSLEHEGGYFINKVIHYWDTLIDKGLPEGYGFSDAVFSMKYGLLVDVDRNLEITAGVGLKYPFSRDVFTVNGVEQPVELQPSSGAYGFVGQLIVHKAYFSEALNVSLLNRYEANGRNKRKYSFGDSWISSLSVSGTILPRFVGQLQVRSEFRASDKTNIGNTKPYSRGSHLLILVPQLSYAFGGKWVVSGFFDLPVYRNYMGEANYPAGTGGQISMRYAGGLSLTRDLNLGR